MGWELTPDNACDLVIRVGFAQGSDEFRTRILEHFTKAENIDVMLTPFSKSGTPTGERRKFRACITHVSVQDALDIEGSVIL